MAEDPSATARATDQPGRFIFSARQVHMVGDAMTARGGTGEAFLAGELLLSGLATCGLAIVTDEARRRDGRLAAAVADTTYSVDPDDTTRVRHLAIAFRVAGIAHVEADVLVRAFTERCPIYNTIAGATPTKMGGRGQLMHLAAFVSAGPVSGSHGGWRHPGADRDITSLGYYTRLARILEHGCFDFVFMADILAVPDRLGASMDSQLRYGALGALRLDPMIVLAAMCGATSHVGLACTISTTYFEPFAVARAMATLDHLSCGRAAWNIVTSFQDAEAQNFGRSRQFAREERYDRADEFLEVTNKLWDSWSDDALVRDPVAPMFADPSKVHPIEHNGRWFNVRGPLNVSRPPQGRPVFLQAGASDRGKDFAARWAEVVFVTHSAPEPAAEFRHDLRVRAERHGRRPDDIKVLPGIVPVVAETRTMAEERRTLLEGLADPTAGLSTLSYHLDIDLSQYPQDEMLPEIDVPGVQGHYREVAELTRRSGIPLRELGRRYGAGRTAAGFTGSASDIVDSMERWVAAGACDGFMVQTPYMPGGLDDFTRLVIPELQRREMFRTRYPGATLRDTLGLLRPSA